MSRSNRPAGASRSADALPPSAGRSDSDAVPGLDRADVAILGGGIAATGAAVFLRQAGLRVVCVEAEAYPHRKVGESLDWSSPWLLRQVGIDPDALLADEVATDKRHIVVHERGAAPWSAAPWPFIARRPLGFETVTLHVDRTALDQRLYERAAALGAAFVWERAATVERDGDRVVAVTTSAGRRIEARWFVDATGTARFLGRAFAIPVTAYGEPKVALWTYLDTPPATLGTSFHVDNADGYLGWIWDIPISPVRTSVGLVVTAADLKARRLGGASVSDIVRHALEPIAAYAGTLPAGELDVSSAGFRPYVSDRVCGDNWFMVGEAAAMPDPLTGNGVTSALRHARYAAAAIAATGDGRVPAAQRRAFERHVQRLGRSFNRSIERTVYAPDVRWAFGLPAATLAYTSFAFFMNALYTRFDPRGRAGMAAFGLLFGAAGLWLEAWGLAARIAGRRRRPNRHAAPAAVTAR